MRTKAGTILAILIAVCLTGSIQGKKFIGSLQTSDGEFLAEKEGRMVLARSGSNSAQNFHRITKVWRISAPYLESADGKFLAIEQGAAGVKVLLTSEKGDSAKWVLDVTGFTGPSRVPRTGILEGSKTQTFRLRVFNGRYEGWYLSATKPAEEQARLATGDQVIRELQVVKDPTQALSFKYIDSYYRGRSHRN